MDVDLAGLLPTVLSAVANLFDYEYRVTKGGVVLFTKRFKDPGEYPNLSWPEISRAARDMIRSISGIYIDPDFSRESELAAQFNSSLTQDQLSQLKGGSSMLVRDMSRLQQGIVRERIYRTMLFGAADRWQFMMMSFDGLPNSSLKCDSIKITLPGQTAAQRTIMPQLNLNLPGGKGQFYSITLYQLPQEVDQQGRNRDNNSPGPAVGGPRR